MEETIIVKKYKFGDMIAIYSINEGNAAFALIPKEDIILLDNEKIKESDSMIQISIKGYDYPRSYSAGHTMRNGQSCLAFKYLSQEKIEDETNVLIKTYFSTEDRQKLVHNLKWLKNSNYLTCWLEYFNHSKESKTIEYITSFSLSCVNPVMQNINEENIYFHRIRSNWSAEGRLSNENIKELQMEPSWLKYGARTERFGQVGSMPVRKYYPFAAVEDKANKICTGAVNCCSTSWQMELYRKNDSISLSGGIADYEFGHWRKKVLPEDSFVTPLSVLTVTKGNVDDVCRRLVTYQNSFINQNHIYEKELPIIFNEFCSTWGEPSEKILTKLINAIKGKKIEYFVIDAGWYRKEGFDWGSSIGDWEPNKKLFPNGMKSITEKIISAGMIPGIWFEFESVTENSEAYKNKGWALKRDGQVLKFAERAFLDMRLPEVNDYLKKKVIDFMNENNFKYIKIDYNDTIGIGCDGAESYGQGLRDVIEGTKNFIQTIKKEVKDVVVEICASGGHRLEPDMMSQGNMGSFSDAHECIEGPIIAANMHRIVLPSMCQIWAVVKAQYNFKKMEYVLTTAFLGRFCLSGEILELSEWQWQTIEAAISFYTSVKNIIRNGDSYIYGNEKISYINPVGWQIIIRRGESDKEILVVVHVFENSKAIDIRINEEYLKNYQLKKRFGSLKINYDTNKGEIGIENPESFTAVAVLMIKQKRGV